MLRSLSKYFVSGLLFFIPAVVTLYLFYAAFMKLDDLLGVSIPGLGLLITVAFITMLGFLASNFLTGWFFKGMDWLFEHIPMVKILYKGIKDVTRSLVGDKKTFTHPVLVAVSEHSDIRMVGFVTDESMEELGLKDLVAVYLPQSYNFAGNLIMVPRERVTPIDAEGSEVLAFVLSGGMAGLEED